MGAFDQAAWYAAHADPAAVVRRVLAPTGVTLRFRNWLDTRTLPLPGGPNRIADLVVGLEDPAAANLPSLLILEFQARHDPDKPKPAKGTGTFIASRQRGQAPLSDQ